jgi:type IV pilus assembly protein PilB
MMKIGEVFLKAGLIKRDDLRIALEEQKTSNVRLGEIFINQGMVSHEQRLTALAEHFQLPCIELKKKYKDIQSEVIEAVPFELSKRFKVLPFEKNEQTLTLAISDPLDIVAIDTIRIKTGHKIVCVLATEIDISEAIDYCYHNLFQMGSHIDNFVNNELSNTTEEDIEDKHYDASDQPVVQYVKSLVVHAVNSRASDIILQPKQSLADLRFRIDGILYRFDPPPKVMISAITTRIKILSGLDISDRRLPQDGRFKVSIGQRTIDIRTSVFPTIYGESVVLRILDASQPLLGLDQLGLVPEDTRNFRELIHHSYGLVLVTGPTGSGKTTTLYTALNEIKSGEKNIVTLEDPVEYRLPFIQQTQVNPQIEFTFAKGLRSILRQDPDIIMVGEIRDKETAEIAINAALTGHLVLSTLHTNDAVGAIVRLVNMGIEPFLISSALLGVMAQRLIRRICQECRQDQEADKKVLLKLGIKESIHKFYRGKGCPACLESGYSGREGIYELLIPNPTIRQYILEKRPSEELMNEARKAGMRTLREVCIEKLKTGITTPEEVLRVTQETNS